MCLPLSILEIKVFLVQHCFFVYYLILLYFKHSIQVCSAISTILKCDGLVIIFFLFSIDYELHPVIGSNFVTNRPFTIPKCIYQLLHSCSIPCIYPRHKQNIIIVLLVFLVRFSVGCPYWIVKFNQWQRSHVIVSLTMKINSSWWYFIVSETIACYMRSLPLVG